MGCGVEGRGTLSVCCLHFLWQVFVGHIGTYCKGGSVCIQGKQVGSWILINSSVSAEVAFWGVLISGWSWVSKECSAVSHWEHQWEDTALWGREQLCSLVRNQAGVSSTFLPLCALAVWVTAPCGHILRWEIKPHDGVNVFPRGTKWIPSGYGAGEETVTETQGSNVP